MAWPFSHPKQEVKIIDTLDSGIPRAEPQAYLLGNTSARVVGVHLNISRAARSYVRATKS